MHSSAVTVRIFPPVYLTCDNTGITVVGGSFEFSLFSSLSFGFKYLVSLSKSSVRILFSLLN